jgi:metal-sulfur cluster biosynthetic enzyme
MVNLHDSVVRMLMTAAANPTCPVSRMMARTVWAAVSSVTWVIWYQHT